jgi:hypothetical protein
VRLEVVRWPVDGGHDIEQTNFTSGEAKTVVTSRLHTDALSRALDEGLGLGFSYTSKIPRLGECLARFGATNHTAERTG